MKKTTFDLICTSVGCLLGSVFYGYFSGCKNGSEVFSTVIDTWFGIWIGYVAVRMNNKDIK